MAFDRLIENIVKMQNPTVAGLDPKLDYVPESIKTKCFEKYGKTLEGAAAALFEFNKALIDALYDIVPAVKPQAAYYEMYGWQGVKALCDTIAYAKSRVCSLSQTASVTISAQLWRHMLRHTSAIQMFQAKVLTHSVQTHSR